MVNESSVVGSPIVEPLRSLPILWLMSETVHCHHKQPLMAIVLIGSPAWRVLFMVYRGWLMQGNSLDPGRCGWNVECVIFNDQSILIQVTTFLWWHMLKPGPWFNIKMTSYQYRKCHCGDKTILRPSYLHNGISYTGKTTSLYWIRAQEPII